MSLRSRRFQATNASADGSSIKVLWTRLEGQLSWFEEPITVEPSPDLMADGTQVVSDTFPSSSVRAWVARPDGTFVKIVAAGSDAPSLAGFPTTMPTLSDAPDPGPPPLTEAEAIALALDVLGF